MAELGEDAPSGGGDHLRHDQAGISPLEPLQDLGVIDRCIENAFGVEYCGDEAVSYC